MEYFLSKLNDREFESLSADIISAVLNLKIEKFKAGKDGGVDGRFWIGKKEGIIQCKHYWRTGYRGLISKLKKEEVHKVKKLKPARYIFISSISLSRENKKEISTIFSPYIKSESDVWGEGDINSFLSKKENQNIVEQNYKLWITSTQVLDILLHNAIKGRSESTIKEIKSHNERYVITNNHKKGAEILKNNNVIIISGEPGIGKTTLANNLALFYIAKGYEFCDIEESISEAEQLFREKENKKIIFYCDDFLGSNMYDAISKKRDSHIVKFINRVKHDNSKKFILTSRTNILTKAVSLSHQFQNKNIREDEFLLKIESLSDIDKAKILYNHIYHSNLDINYIDEIYKKERYKNIISHKNFNPRIVEFITDNKRVSAIKPDQYWNYIVNKLDNPEDIWSNYFQNQIDDSVRVLSFLTVFNSGQISEKQLRRAYSTYRSKFKIQIDHTDGSFNTVRKLAIKSMLNRSHIRGDLYEYSMFNPSISDFILNYYLEENELIISILKSLGSYSSIVFLRSLLLNKKISKQSIQDIQNELFEHFYKAKIKLGEWDYLILLSSLNFTNPHIVCKIASLVNEMSNYKYVKGRKIYELLELLLEFKDCLKIKDFSFVTEYIKCNSLDEIEINLVVKLIKEYKIKDEMLFENLGEEVDSFLRDVLEDNKSSADIGQYINGYCNDDGDVDYDIDYSGIQGEIESILDSILSDLDEELFKYVSVDDSDIVESVDVDKEVDEYISRTYHDSYDGEYRGLFSAQKKSESDIDAIFERN